MGKIWMPGGGGGADLDVVTAGKPDVLTGKVIVDKDGDPLTGTMVNRGGVSQGLGVNGTYIIPEGYHNGTGKVTQNIPIQGADVTGTDRAWATNISCWEGAACLGVRNAHYLNGVNWIQGNISNFYAGNIKKGVNMGGLVGTFEGYVPTANDLYVRGNNVKGWINSYNNSYLSLDAGQITLKNVYKQYPAIHVNNLNLTGYTHLNIEGYGSQGAGSTKSITLYRIISFSPDNRGTIGYLDLTNYNGGNYVYSFNISTYQIAGTIQLQFYQMDGAIYRIWLS